jgi:broad specificity phosphatase PhoE
VSAENTRVLYLARHAEPDPDGRGLTASGARQAEHLGRRLSRLSLSHITHGPLPRAAETARIVAEQFEHPPALQDVEVAGDYVPYVPDRDELPDAWKDAVLSAFADVSDDEASHGAALGSRAIDLLAGPSVTGRETVEVVITHAFTVGWLVRHALGAPAWRWWPPTQCHAGLTVIRYETEGPPAVLVANDVAHLPEDLRWTGFPDHLRV